MLNILSLGAGVQSTTVLLLSINGILPPIDCAIFADTQCEPKSVYRHLEFLKEIASKNNILIYTVTQGNLLHDILDNGGGGAPFYIKNSIGRCGMVKRQCTRDYKIAPIESFIKTNLLKLNWRAKWPQQQVIRQWMGISIDEFHRCRRPTKSRMSRGKFKIYDQKWKSNYYPLCGYEFWFNKSEKVSDIVYTRQQCLEWLKINNYPEPPRSACIFCPYHSDLEWSKLKQSEDWLDIVKFDNNLRNIKCSGISRLRGDRYLHKSLLPINEVNFNINDTNSISSEECLGYCGN